MLKKDEEEEEEELFLLQYFVPYLDAGELRQLLSVPSILFAFSNKLVALERPNPRDWPLLLEGSLRQIEPIFDSSALSILGAKILN